MQDNATAHTANKPVISLNKVFSQQVIKLRIVTSTVTQFKHLWLLFLKHAEIKSVQQ
jgi:hypothetical protein